MFSNFKAKNNNLITYSTNTKNNDYNCCGSKEKSEMQCPKCNAKAKGVLGKTLQHLLLNKTKEKLSCLNRFYYCKTTSCEVVYFRDKDILTQKDMSVVVGLKKGAKPMTICYCFEWSKEKIKKEIEKNTNSLVLEDIKYKMDTIGCKCEILNPSGACCLGDVFKFIKEIKIELNMNYN